MKIVIIALLAASLVAALPRPDQDDDNISSLIQQLEDLDNKENADHLVGLENKEKAEQLKDLNDNDKVEDMDKSEEVRQLVNLNSQEQFEQLKELDSQDHDQASPDKYFHNKTVDHQFLSLL
jgi:predicted ArsR family transcriptional regulator